MLNVLLVSKHYITLNNPRTSNMDNMSYNKIYREHSMWTLRIGFTCLFIWTNEDPNKSINNDFHEESKVNLK